MNKRFLGILAFLLLTVGSIWFFNEWRASAEDDKSELPSALEAGINVNKKIPQFTLMSLEKKEITVKSSQKPIILNFFTTWCPPCREEMPEIDLFVKKYKNKVDFYAVNIQESVDETASFMDKNGYSFKEAVLLDVKSEVAERFRVNAIPTTIITDKEGVIRYRKTGPVTLSELERVLGKL